MLSPGASPGRRWAWARCSDRSRLGACKDPLPWRAMRNRLALAVITAVLGACASAPPAPSVAPQTLDDYKHAVAMRIAALSPAAYSVPPPEMLKSVVVLEITLDSVGAPLEVSVF